jgi:RNA polymerase sigma-70 factor (ECF subfamily)
MVAPLAERRSDERGALFDRLYEQHRQALHAFFLGRTGDPELALDLLQEAFVRAWRNLELLLALPSSRQRAWLFTAARNLVVDQYRSRVARSAAHDALIASTTPDDQLSDGPETTVERDRDLRLVDEAIRRLPDDLRTVLVLQVLGEKTSGEIGELLDRPAGTVRYQLSRARKRLADEIRLLDASPEMSCTSASSAAPGQAVPDLPLARQEVLPCPRSNLNNPRSPVDGSTTS